MRTIILLAALIILTACGRETDVDSGLRAIVDRYVSLAGSQGKLDDVASIGYGEPGDGRRAVCERPDSFVASNSPTAERKVIVRRGDAGAILDAVVMHELAHCLHDKRHVDSVESLMSPSLYENESYWQEHLDDRVRELFDNG